MEDEHDTDQHIDPVAILTALCDPAEVERRAHADPLTPELIATALALRQGDAGLLVARRLRALGIAALGTVELELMAACPDPRVRLIVARYFATPPTLLRQLLDDPSEEVRAGLVWNFNYRAEARRRLAEDCSEAVRTALSETTDPGCHGVGPWHRRVAELRTAAAQGSSRTKRSRASRSARTAS